MKGSDEQDYLRAAADMAASLAAENPDIGIALDPDVADFMGAFTENALSLNDVIDDNLDDGDLYD